MADYETLPEPVIFTLDGEYRVRGAKDVFVAARTLRTYLVAHKLIGRWSTVTMEPVEGTPDEYREVL